MGKPAAAAVAESPRKDAEEALRLDRLGRHDEALALVDGLAAKCPGSAMVLHLAGRVHLFTGRRAAKAHQSAEMERHLLSARGYLAEAKRLVPDCTDISLLLAGALHESSKHDEADDELTRAIGIAFPVDPAENNIVYSMGGRMDSTRGQRVEFSRESLRLFSQDFAESVCNDHVPRVVREVLELDTDERQGAVKALKMANDLAKRYHYSSRAQCIRAYMRLKFACGLDAAIDRRPFLEGILIDMNEATRIFDSSIVLAMFRAKLFFVLGLYEFAEIECRRALVMVQPVDPNLEDVPPGSVSGEEYDDRISSICEELGRLMGMLVRVATDYWYSMTSEKQDSFLSGRLVDLHEYFLDTYENEHWAARTIADALSFVKKNRSWRFWICPYCAGRKLPDTDSLLRHMCNKHPAEKVLSKLQLVLVPKQSGDRSEDDYILDEISVCQDSDDNYIFHFKKRDDIFEKLFSIPCMEIDGKSFAEIREEKCKEGSMTLQEMKQKLTNLPADKMSTEFDNARPEIEGLWHDFLKISALDYRVVISSLAKSFIWTKLIKCMREDNAASKKSSTSADIDAIFPNVVDLGTGPKSEVHVEDENSGAMVNDKPSDQPTNMVEDGNKLNGTPENVGTDLKCDSSKGTSLPSSSDQSYITENVGTELRYDSTEETSPCSSSDQNYIMENTGSNLLGTSDQPAEEMPSISRYKRSVDVLKKYNADEDLFFLNVIVQSLWNLRCFRNEILRRPPACFHLMHEGPCIAGKLYEIFALEKTEHLRMVPLLTDMKTTLCEILHDSEMFHKVGRISLSRIQVGRNFASEIMAMIIEGLHKSETYLHFGSNGKSEKVVIDPASCTNFICRAHDLFGIKLKQLMSCSCGEWFGEEYTSIFHGLDASSLYTTKTKSLAQLPVLMDQQFNREIKCNKCSGSVKHIDCFLSHGRHFFTIVLKNWKVGDISKATMSEAFFGIASPFDIALLYRGVTLPCEGVRSSTKYNLVLAVCHVEQRYVCFVRDQDKWHIYDMDTVKVLDSWEELLERYKEMSLQPEVLFFEVIK